MSIAWASSTTTAGHVVSTATASTGTEGAPSAATDGLDVSSVAGYAVHVETAGTMTAGGVLQAYIYNHVSASPGWTRSPDLDLVVSALAKQAFVGFQLGGHPVRIAYSCSGVGVACSVYLFGFKDTKR